MNKFNSEKMQDRFDSVTNEVIETLFNEVDLILYEEEVFR